MENQSVFEKVLKASNALEIEKIVDEHYPGWFVCALQGYSKDYPHLTHNWQTICDRAKTSPKAILLVSDISFDDEKSDKMKLCEYFTRLGWVVRRSSEFMACSKCEKAIPCEQVWCMMKERGVPCPDNWSNQCTEC
jgi:hypothetical protein